jgi:hypothetical protein
MGKHRLRPLCLLKTNTKVLDGHSHVNARHRTANALAHAAKCFAVVNWSSRQLSKNLAVVSDPVLRPADLLVLHSTPALLSTIGPVALDPDILYSAHAAVRLMLMHPVQPQEIIVPADLRIQDRTRFLLAPLSVRLREVLALPNLLFRRLDTLVTGYFTRDLADFGQKFVTVEVDSADKHRARVYARFDLEPTPGSIHFERTQPILQPPNGKSGAKP